MLIVLATYLSQRAVSLAFHDAKIDDIVAAASVAKGTFYLYFPANSLFCSAGLSSKKTTGWYSRPARSA